MESAAPGFQFPGWFEVKALGPVDAGLADVVPGLLAGLGLRIAADSLSTRPSSGGRYIAVSVTIECASREQLVAAHAALRAHPDIRWTL